MKKTILALLPLALLAARAPAEEKSEATSPRKSATPLKVQVVFTRSQGERKQSSLPYTISLAAPGRPARLRMGIEVPVPVVSGKEPTPSFQYRNVGTNLDCSADLMADGRYKLDLTIEQSSIHSPEGERKTTAVADIPFFRSFNASFSVVLGDGQTAPYVLATDPVSGEVLKVEVTLTVLK
jgi:Flp pilus assembly secretin CpaC